MARHTARKRLMSEINVVPYIDVMLVLLVIFMITAPLLAQGVKVDLPKAPAKPLERADAEPLVVVVDAKGHFYIQFGEKQDQPVDAATLVNRVNAVMRPLRFAFPGISRMRCAPIPSRYRENP